MRDNFNISALSNNMFANLNSLIPVPDLPVVTNISTNVYYGYQPLPIKNDYEESNLVENTEMEVQYNISPENHTNIQEITRVVNRKRRCPGQPEVEFKKRRRNDCAPDPSSPPKFGRKPTHNLSDLPREAKNLERKSVQHWELNLEEELLKQTHGFCSYHWRNETDL